MWPDWRNQVCAIVASGASAGKTDIKSLRGRARIIAIKRSVELVPFADVVYGCDGHWWRSVQGLQSFRGLKLSYDAGVCSEDWSVRKVSIPVPNSKTMSFERTGVVGAGGSSGFQALNLALQFGSRRVLLIGFDAHGDDGKQHWYGRNNWAMCSNPTAANYRSWITAFDLAAPAIRALGASVINVSISSSLRVFNRMGLEEALAYWEKQDAA